MVSKAGVLPHADTADPNDDPPSTPPPPGDGGGGGGPPPQISASYSYLANSPLVSQIAFKLDQTTKMTTTRQYDLLDRLTSISSALALAGSMAIGYGYQYDSLDQRTRQTQADSSYWAYGYDNLGQVTSGQKFWSGGTPVAGDRVTYTFDQIGNRRSTSSGITQPASTYTLNLLNVILCRTVPGTIDNTGEATNATAAVLVNNQIPVRQGKKKQFDAICSFAGKHVATDTAVFLTVWRGEEGNFRALKNALLKKVVSEHTLLILYSAKRR